MSTGFLTLKLVVIIRPWNPQKPTRITEDSMKPDQGHIRSMFNARNFVRILMLIQKLGILAMVYYNPDITR